MRSAALSRPTDVDGLAVFELIEDGNDIALTHSPTRSGDDSLTLLRSASQLFPWSYTHARAGTLACFSSLDEISDATERETLAHRGTRAGVVVPFSIDGHPAGAVSFLTTREPQP